MIGKASVDNRYTAWQFVFFRMALGAYLLWHFAVLLPDAVEIFSSEGVLSDPAANFTYPLALWNPLAWWNGPVFVTVWVGLCAVASLLFLLGWRREWMALILWFGWACLFNRNNFISNPSIPYIGMLLLLCALIPAGEPLRLDRRQPQSPWRMPVMIPVVAWVLMAVGYTFSGLDKLASPSWQDGSALRHLLENPLARDNWMREGMLALPGGLIACLTWGVLIAEITFAPLCLWRRGRAIAWTVMLAMHFGILTVVAFADLSLGMVMLHLFTFDSRWVRARVPAGRPVLLFDGACGLCSQAVRFVAEEDRTGRIGLAPLQSETGQRLLHEHGIPTETMDTMVFICGERAYVRTDAALAVAACLGGLWRLTTVARIIPRKLRDAAYRSLAKNRHRLFGATPACGLPSSELRKRLAEYM